MLPVEVGLIVAKRFTLVSSLNAGGCGATFIADDAFRPSLQVLIKHYSLKGRGSRAEAKLLFEQEAQRLQQIGRHSQVPSVDSFFVDGLGCFLVQEYCKGTSYSDASQLKGEPEVRSILEQVLKVLQFAHDGKVVHGDIKPVNIIKSEKDEVMLVDWSLRDSVSHPNSETKSGPNVYGAPEDRSGTPQGDLFSLAATCVSLMTGRQPGSQPQSGDLGSAWGNLLRGSTFSPHLKEILSKMLLLSGEFESSEAVLKALSALPSPQKPLEEGVRKTTNSSNTRTSSSNTKTKSSATKGSGCGSLIVLLAFASSGIFGLGSFFGLWGSSGEPKVNSPVEEPHRMGTDNSSDFLQNDRPVETASPSPSPSPNR